MNWALLGAIGAVGSGLVLLNAGWWKLRHRPAFMLVLREHGSWMAANAGWLSLALSIVELAGGVGALSLLLPPSVRPELPLWLPLLGVTLLGGLFAGYGIVQLARGKTPRCGCLNARDRLGPHTVLRAFTIGCGGLAGTLTASPGPDPVSPPLWVITAGAGGLMLAVVLLIGLPLLSDANPARRQPPLTP